MSNPRLTAQRSNAPVKNTPVAVRLDSKRALDAAASYLGLALMIVGPKPAKKLQE